jgi:predicted metalloprotease with PDZ domain
MAVRYVLSLPDPETHLAHVTVEVPVERSAASIDLTMPAWCPGSYLIRDYARFVRDLGAFGPDGSALAVRKVDKSTWRIGVPPGAAKVIVHYRVYGHDLSVRTNHVDGSHAFLHGPATFAHVPALRAEPVTIEVLPPPGRGWALACGLWQGDAAPVYHLTAASIDELYDSPLHLGHGTTRRFTAGGVPVELAVWGEAIPGGAFSLDTLVADLGAIVDDHARRIGEVPFPHYTFMLMLSHDAYGGLEHRASSANLHNPKALALRKEYEGLLELLSHELFHAWNGKRIAPAALFDFDLSKEAHTRCLWVMEGLTSHYDRWALRTSGRIPAKSYLEKVLDDWTRFVATPGRRRQSLEESSFDAWIKLYKPDESNLNTTVSYYLKGGLVATALDLEIRRRTEGGRSLDDVLRALWREHGSRGVPHPEDVQPIFEQASGLSLADVFDRQIRGVADPELAVELAHVGLELRGVHDPALIADGATPVWIGATLGSGAPRVTGVLDDTPAAAAGLSPGDELVAIDGFRTPTDAEARALLSVRRPGDVVAISLFRRNRLHAVQVTLAAAPATKWEIAGPAELAPDAAARYQAWIGEPHPGAGQVLATVACATRWI